MEVSKTLEDEGRTITQINASHLGKRLRYNILVTRKGSVAGRTQMAFDDLIGEGCIDDGSGLIRPIAAEVDRADLGIGDDFSLELRGCRVTGWVSGDNKGNLDPTAPGNQFHVHITVEVAQPASAAVVAAPRQVVNRVTASIAGSPDSATGTAGNNGPCCEQSFTLTTSTNLTPVTATPVALTTPVTPALTASAIVGPAPVNAVTLPVLVDARLAGPVEVAGVTVPAGRPVQIIALPPGTVLQTPSSGGPAIVPPGSVLGITDENGFNRITTTTAVPVELGNNSPVRAPAPRPFPQTGMGPAPVLLPQTGSGPAAGFGGAVPGTVAGVAGLVTLLGALLRSAGSRRRQPPAGVARTAPRSRTQLKRRQCQSIRHCRRFVVSPLTAARCPLPAL